MNETERDRILRMVSEGTLRPNEAAPLLASLAETPNPEPEKSAKSSKPAEEPEKAKPKPQMMEVQMQRADGSHYTIEVPPSLVPMFLKMAGVAIRESARTAAQDAWLGFKTMVKNKTAEVKTNVKTKVSGPGKKTEEASPAVTPEQEQQAEARRRILQMVQNGRISATDASRLIEQMDALHEFQKTHPAPSS